MKLTINRVVQVEAELDFTLRRGEDGGVDIMCKEGDDVWYLAKLDVNKSGKVQLFTYDFISERSSLDVNEDGRIKTTNIDS
jgi:hypothetical protein